MFQKTTLKDFLIEATVVDHPDRKKTFIKNADKLEKKDLKKLYKKLMRDCPSAFTHLLENKSGIFRGEIHQNKKGEDIYRDVWITDYSKGIREAQNTQDYYRLLIDEVFQRKNFPLRKRSMICSTDDEYAAGYGDLFYVLPFEHVNIASLNARDIFEIDVPFLNDTLDVDSLSHLFYAIISKSGKNQIDSEDLTIQSLSKTLSSIDFNVIIKSLERLDLIKDVNSLKSKFKIENSDDLIEYCIKALEKASNKFTLRRPKEFYRKPPKHSEIWFSGKAYLIYSRSSVLEGLKKIHKNDK